ncbi:MAG: hypothetical protein RG741_10925, partial [Bacteroidales bacterium]|nr:hypothetical protein [Bacteroidales bacterium]
MKNTMYKLLATIALIGFFSLSSIAQPPPPDNHGESENQPAPIGSGIAILLSLGAAYGAKKVFDARKKI